MVFSSSIYRCAGCGKEKKGFGQEFPLKLTIVLEDRRKVKARNAREWHKDIWLCFCNEKCLMKWLLSIFNEVE